jgi:hypothetical protein
MTTAVKRQHEPQRIVGDLLNAEINEKQARSINCRATSLLPRPRETKNAICRSRADSVQISSG